MSVVTPKKMQLSILSSHHSALFQSHLWSSCSHPPWHPAQSGRLKSSLARWKLDQAVEDTSTLGTFLIILRINVSGHTPKKCNFLFSMTNNLWFFNKSLFWPLGERLDEVDGRPSSGLCNSLFLWAGPVDTETNSQDRGVKCPGISSWLCAWLGPGILLQTVIKTIQIQYKIQNNTIKLNSPQKKPSPQKIK